MTAHAKTLTIAFYVAFALWFTATRYGPPGLYGRFLAPTVVNILYFCPILLFFIIAALAVRRAVRAASFPRLEVAAAGCAIVGSELFWRFYLSPHAWDAFKLTSIAFDLATPVIAALGLAVVVRELKQSPQPIAA